MSVEDVPQNDHLESTVCQGSTSTTTISPDSLNFSDNSAMPSCACSRSCWVIFIKQNFGPHIGRNLMAGIYDLDDLQGQPCASDGAELCFEKWLVDVIRFGPSGWSSPIEPITQANCHPQCPESANNPDCAL